MNNYTSAGFTGIKSTEQNFTHVIIATQENGQKRVCGFCGSKVLAEKKIAQEKAIAKSWGVIESFIAYDLIKV